MGFFYKFYLSGASTNASSIDTEHVSKECIPRQVCKVFKVCKSVKNITGSFNIYKLSKQRYAKVYKDLKKMYEI